MPAASTIRCRRGMPVNTPPPAGPARCLPILRDIADLRQVPRSVRAVGCSRQTGARAAWIHRRWRSRQQPGDRWIIGTKIIQRPGRREFRRAGAGQSPGACVDNAAGEHADQAISKGLMPRRLQPQRQYEVATYPVVEPCRRRGRRGSFYRAAQFISFSGSP